MDKKIHFSNIVILKAFDSGFDYLELTLVCYNLVTMLKHFAATTFYSYFINLYMLALTK